MIMSLTFISLAMAAALGFVYTSTKGPIEQANQKKVVDAIAKVVPAFDNDPVKEQYALFADGDSVYFFPAKKGGVLVGTAVKTFTQKGFSGRINIMVGLLPDGTINKTEVLEQKETPGLGTLMKEPKFKDQFDGKNPVDFKLMVKKDGGDVDAITAATISSRAYCDALQRAIDLYKQAIGTTDSSSAEIADTLVLTSQEPLKKVLPAFDNNPLKDVQNIDGLEMFTAKKGSKVTGYAVKSVAKGYNEKDPIWVLTGFNPDGSINKVTVLQHKESQGKGSQACEDEFLAQFIGKNPATFKLTVSEEGGNVDGISGCTVSATGVCKAIENGYNAFKKGGVK